MGALLVGLFPSPIPMYAFLMRQLALGMSRTPLARSRARFAVADRPMILAIFDDVFCSKPILPPSRLFFQFQPPPLSATHKSSLICPHCQNWSTTTLARSNVISGQADRSQGSLVSHRIGSRPKISLLLRVDLFHYQQTTDMYFLNDQVALVRWVTQEAVLGKLAL